MSADVARRVAIQHEIALQADPLDGDTQERAERLADLTADACWSAIHHHGDLRGELVALAAECQSWLEAIDAEMAR